MDKLYDLAVMHDFFVDRIVFVKSFKGFTNQVIEKAKSGGGSIHGVKQLERAGGNAVNLARWASFFGLRTLLITHSDKQHVLSLKMAAKGVTMLVKDIEPGYTVSLESDRNVMVSDVGGAGIFRPDLLTEEDWREIQKAKMLCLMNWSANKFGTELLFEARKRYRGRIFFDPADFRDRIGSYAHLIRAAASDKIVNWYSFNEYEAKATGQVLGIKCGLKKLCLLLAKRLSARVDIHTSSISVTSDGEDLSFNVHRRVREKVRTGAGDIWNAASIYSEFNGYDAVERLAFSDNIATTYVTSCSEEEARKKIKLFLEHS